MNREKYINEFSNFRSYVRISMHSYFLDIALTSKKEVGILKKQLEDDIAAGYQIIGDEPNQRIIMNRHNEVVKSEEALTREIIKSVVFLAMYCEAYIWDLAASIMGDNYAKKYVDKLDTFSKWVIIPKLLFGVSLDVGHHSMEKLKELIRWRNNFVHSKSKDARDFPQTPDKFEKDFTPLDQQMDLDDIFNKISELFVELQKIDPEGSHNFRTEPH